MKHWLKFTPLIWLLVALSLSQSACQAETPVQAQGTLHGDLQTLDPSGALVIYWHAFTGQEEMHLLEMIDDFNASNPWSITVVAENVGDTPSLYRQIAAGLASEKVPNLVSTEPSLTAAYALQEAIVPLSPYLESRKWGLTRVEENDFFPSALSTERTPQLEDELFSVPLCRSLQLLYYNVDWLKELGYEDPPATWEGFQEMACAASQPAEGLYGFELGMQSSLFTDLLATQGVSPLTASSDRYTLGGEQGRAALQFLQTLVADGCASWETEMATSLNFAAGQVLFAIDSTALIPTYATLVEQGANFDWHVSLLPQATEEPVVGVGGPSLAILHTSPEEQLAAWVFVRWLLEPQQQARWTQKAACFPVRETALAEMEEYGVANTQQRAATQYLDQSWVPEPGVPAYATCRAAIARTLYAVTAGESIEQWLAQTRNDCNQSLTDFMGQITNQEE
jgi:multiple sugar transport system substrate-binding protein/sn-glycerol 3-phosphate transport system substrate-binding protein